MKRQSPMQIFLRGFLKSFLIIILLVGAGGISYKATLLYYEKFGVPVNNRTENRVRELLSDGQVEEVSKNLIYCVDEQKGKIKKMVLEIFNSKNANLAYITIPENMQITIPYETYQRLCTINGDLPQIITIAELHKYFQEEALYECVMIILEDFFDVEFSYYTALSETGYKECFETETGGAYVEHWTSTFRSTVSSIKTEEELKALIKSYYKKLESNLTLKNKQSLCSAYLKVKQEQIQFYSISGETEGKVFIADVEEVNALLHKVLKNNATVTSQGGITANETGENAQEEKSAVGLNIEVLNSTNITGLASLYREKLVADGLTVLKIGNYTGGTLQQSKIVVREEAYGNDILKYLPHAVVEKGELMQGIDMQIVLGADAQQ